MDTNQYISDVHEINLSKRSWLASDKCVSSIQQKTAWEADQTVQWRGCYFIQNASCGLFYSFHCIPSFQFVSSYHVISCRFISCRFIHAFFVSSHWISFQINSVHFMPSHFISIQFNSTFELGKTKTSLRESRTSIISSNESWTMPPLILPGIRPYS